MPITVKCTACGQDYTVRDELAGKRVKCQCGAAFAVPAPAPLDDVFDAELGEAAGPSAPSPGGLPPAAGARLGPVPRKQSGDKTVLVFGVIAAAVTVVLLAALVIFMLTRNRDTAASNSRQDDKAPASIGQSTPRAVFEAAKQAAVEGDWKTQFSLVTPETQDLAVVGIALAAVSLAKDNKDLADVLKKHGIDQSMWENEPPNPAQGNFREMMQQRMEQCKKVVKDKQAFLADVMGHIEKAGQEMMKKSGLAGNLQEKQAKAQAAAKLSDVVIKGNTATGKQSSSVGGKTTSMPVEFRKIDDKWYIHQAGSGQLK